MSETDIVIVSHPKYMLNSAHLQAFFQKKLNFSSKAINPSPIQQVHQRLN